MKCNRKKLFLILYRWCGSSSASYPLLEAWELEGNVFFWMSFLGSAGAIGIIAASAIIITGTTLASLSIFSLVSPSALGISPASYIPSSWRSCRLILLYLLPMLVPDSCLLPRYLVDCPVFVYSECRSPSPTGSLPYYTSRFSESPI